MKMARYSFSGSMPFNVATNKHLEKLPPVVLDKDEKCHDQGCNDFRSELV